MRPPARLLMMVTIMIPKAMAPPRRKLRRFWRLKFLKAMDIILLMVCS
jgi:hypothetical protein